MYAHANGKGTVLFLAETAWSVVQVVLVRRKSTGVLYAMKILKKGDVVRKRQVERTKIERRVLGNVEHPFLMRLHYAFQVHGVIVVLLMRCDWWIGCFVCNAVGRLACPVAALSSYE